MSKRATVDGELPRFLAIKEKLKGGKNNKVHYRK